MASANLGEMRTESTFIRCPQCERLLEVFGDDPSPVPCAACWSEGWSEAATSESALHPSPLASLHWIGGFTVLMFLWANSLSLFLVAELNRGPAVSVSTRDPALPMFVPKDERR